MHRTLKKVIDISGIIFKFKYLVFLLEKAQDLTNQNLDISSINADLLKSLSLAKEDNDCLFVIVDK